MTRAFTDLDRLSIDTIRTLAIDAIEKARSGHPGMPLGAAPMAYVLWHRHLRFDPAVPDWPDRDRFVLSGGHGSMLLYALLHLTGHDLSLEDLQQFRQWGSRTPGHPEFGLTPGVEATTGPLGQGMANAVGMAMAERWSAAHYGRPGHAVVDHHTYALVTDGDLMEGVAAEAASLAGHLGLGKLICLYDANDVTLDGPASLSFTEDVAGRFAAYGWHVATVEDGDTDLEAIDAAIEAARAETGRPSLIVVRTTLGYGSPHKAGTHAAHGSPLGEEEARATKQALGWPYDTPFTVPEEVRAHFALAAERGRTRRAQWAETFAGWAQAFPELAAQWELAQAGELPADFDAALPEFSLGENQPTRSAGGACLQALAASVPWLLGGDADLSSSTKTRITESGDFGDGDGRNIHFGVREHAMGAIANGMLYHGGLRPYVSTFFVFSDYMRPPLRLAALSELPLISVFTHDSIAVGEDGPTHEPVEHLAALRAIPHLRVIRPADANETGGAWRQALLETRHPVAIVLTRQKVRVVSDPADAREGVARGGWILREREKARGTVLATGSEVELALDAAERLESEGLPLRVVSMPCLELFEEQDPDYRHAVLGDLPRAAIEAGVALGWHRYVGEAGLVIALDRFGASAPGERVQRELGFSVEAVCARLREYFV